MITVRAGDSRLNFPEAASYDYVRWDTSVGTGTADYSALTLFDSEGNAVATFYKWDGVDAGETP